MLSDLPPIVAKALRGAPCTGRLISWPAVETCWNPFCSARATFPQHSYCTVRVNASSSLLVFSFTSFLLTPPNFLVPISSPCPAPRLHSPRCSTSSCLLVGANPPSTWTRLQHFLVQPSPACSCHSPCPPWPQPPPRSPRSPSSAKLVGMEIPRG